MENPSRSIDISGIWLFFAGLFISALISFWPTYFALGLVAHVGYVHFHAAAATLWILMLIIQPWLIKTHRYDLHRAVGKISFVLVPIIVIGMLLLANYRIRTVPADAYHIQTYVLWLQFSLVAVFAISYAFAMLNRKNSELHARFMVCTGLTLIDPVFARAIFWISPESVFYHQWLTFGLTDAIFLALIWVERRNQRARWVFPVMLCVFLVSQIPALFWWTDWPIWQAVAEWFRTVPLT